MYSKYIDHGYFFPFSRRSLETNIHSIMYLSTTSSIVMIIYKIWCMPDFEYQPQATTTQIQGGSILEDTLKVTLTIFTMSLTLSILYDVFPRNLYKTPHIQIRRSEYGNIMIWNGRSSIYHAPAPLLYSVDYILFTLLIIVYWLSLLIIMSLWYSFILSNIVMALHDSPSLSCNI